MRYDKNYAFFAPHHDWYTIVIGVGYVPTEKAPPEAVKAIEDFNSYTFTKNYLFKKDNENEEKK